MSIDPAADQEIRDELEDWSRICGAPVTEVPYEVGLSDSDGNDITDVETARTALAALFGNRVGVPEPLSPDYGSWLVTLNEDTIVALHDQRFYTDTQGGWTINIELP